MISQTKQTLIYSFLLAVQHKPNSCGAPFYPKISTRILKKGQFLSQSECSKTHVRNICQVSFLGLFFETARKMQARTTLQRKYE